MERPVVLVEPEAALASRARLFAALAEAFGVEIVSAAPARSVVAARIVFEPAPGEHVTSSVPALHFVSRGRQESPPDGIAYARSPILPPCLQGRTLNDRRAGSFAPLPLGESDEVLASTSNGPLWVADRRSGRERAAGLPEELQPADALRDRFKPGDAFSLLPLVVFLGRVAESHGLRRPPLRAAIVIDDPNLHRPTYGFVDFRRLAALARLDGFHVAFSTIPLDAWFAARTVAAGFRGDQGPLSLHIHGNDHVHHELARDVPEATGLAEMAQAVRRIESLESRTGLSVSRVMVPPHGACSSDTLHRLARVGFDAICMSAPESAIGQHRPLTRWLPADMVGGFPIIPRHHLADDPDDFVLRALLGQPLIAYGHHTDAAQGLDIFREVARRISSLGDVRWMSLGQIARSNVQVFAGEGGDTIQLYSRNATIELEHPSRIVIEPADESCEIRVTANGMVLSGPGPHQIDTPGEIRVVSRRHDAVEPAAVAPPGWKPWPAARRALTETRDRTQPLGARAHRLLAG